MKIFITGATGYIGSQLVNCLTRQEEEINILVRNVHATTIPKVKNIKCI